MFLITSKFEYCVKDENCTRIPCKIPDENGILTLIKRHITRYQRLLIIANDPSDYTDNDNVAQVLGQAFVMTNQKFDEIKVLDNRTRDQAATLIQNADLIFMRGGEILRQLEFLQQIYFHDLIKNYSGIVITVSAASMCLTNIICNFPEHKKELAQPRFIKGLGIVDLILIPHFDGKTLTYQGHTDFPNLVQDYILPYSDKHLIYALPNGSYIRYDGINLKFFGPYYKLIQRNVVALNIC